MRSALLCHPYHVPDHLDLHEVLYLCHVLDYYHVLDTASSSLLTIGAMATDMARLIAVVTYNICKTIGSY